MGEKPREPENFTEKKDIQMPNWAKNEARELERLKGITVPHWLIEGQEKKVQESQTFAEDFQKRRRSLRQGVEERFGEPTLDKADDEMQRLAYELEFGIVNSGDFKESEKIIRQFSEFITTLMDAGGVDNLGDNLGKMTEVLKKSKKKA